MSNYNDLLQQYQNLIGQADDAFAQAQKEYQDQIKCYAQCSDCCYAVFGLFPIEAAYLSQSLQQLSAGTRKHILEQARLADAQLAQVQEKLAQLGDNPKAADKILSEARIRCPLLDGERKCYLYQYRPITCRVYGMPTIINGKVHACWQSGFENGKPYPTFNLDAMYKELYDLSAQLVERTGVKDKDNDDQAALLVSVAHSLMGPKLQG